MKKIFSCFLVGLITCLTLACSSKDSQDKKVIATINDYPLTLDEFQYELASEMELDKDFKLTREAKRKFLNRLIQKELLIQEAKRLKLDTREEFRRAIEKYWESTLIKNLLELKGKEIAKKCVVSEEEIVDRYDEMLRKNPDTPPLSDIRDQIKTLLKEEKKTRLLEQWMQGLKKTAKIKMNQDLL